MGEKLIGEMFASNLAPHCFSCANPCAFQAFLLCGTSSPTSYIAEAPLQTANHKMDEEQRIIQKHVRQKYPSQLIKQASRDDQRNVKPSSTSTANPKSTSTRDIYEIEGTLEMQKMLLQKLAQQENTAKGLISKWPGRGPGGQRIMDSRWEASSESTASASDADPETCRKEVALAISTIWRRQ